MHVLHATLVFQWQRKPPCSWLRAHLLPVANEERHFEVPLSPRAAARVSWQRAHQTRPGSISFTKTLTRNNHTTLAMTAHVFLISARSCTPSWPWPFVLGNHGFLSGWERIVYMCNIIPRPRCVQHLLLYVPDTCFRDNINSRC